jgi:hypothetical protein
VIPVLLASSGVSACRLDVARRRWTYPDIGPRGGNCQRTNPCELRHVAYGSPRWVDVTEASPRASATDARDGVRDVAKSSDARGLLSLLAEQRSVLHGSEQCSTRSWLDRRLSGSEPVA